MIQLLSVETVNEPSVDRRVLHALINSYERDPDQLQVFIPPKSDGISVCGKRNITVNTVYKEALSQHNT